MGYPLFGGGNLDIGKVALQPGAGANGRNLVGKSVRTIGQNVARIDAARPRQGSGPDIRNSATVPPKNVV